ncbi:RDD family protein [Ectothiorhodospiraceae bacterium BW-2]|nr:RDD family protein [Ectothiorhodospiraceae bacterium BW-2]
MSPPPFAPSTCGLWRLLAILLYDSLLLFGVIFIAHWLLLLLLGPELTGSGHPLLFLYTLLVAFLFLGGFWTHGGQTLGMKAWRVKVVNLNGEPLSWSMAAMRFIAALVSWSLLGLGFLWIGVDREQRSWHDILSKTRLIRLFE